MRMPQPTCSVLRNGLGTPPMQSLAPGGRLRAPSAAPVLPSGDQCFGVYEGCKDQNSATPCLAYSAILGYYCSSCCLGGG
ncbi:MAG TPA: hypothetical protein VGZ22_04160 [Isosphaeraceae bacterium]|jgi:hypothetical protein|nr:hypothetical protein [Isosphaeraceae bacterium]